MNILGICDILDHLLGGIFNRFFVCSTHAHTFRASRERRERFGIKVGTFGVDFNCCLTEENKGYSHEEINGSEALFAFTDAARASHFLRSVYAQACALYQTCAHTAQKGTSPQCTMTAQTMHGQAAQMRMAVLRASALCANAQLNS